MEEVEKEEHPTGYDDPTVVDYETEPDKQLQDHVTCRTESDVMPMTSSFNPDPFRLAVEKWQFNILDTCANASDAVQSAERNRNKSVRLQLDKNVLSREIASSASRQLADRIKALRSQQFEVQQEWELMTTEIELMADEKRRLEKALLITNIPMLIIAECLERRCRRLTTECLADPPLKQMEKEQSLVAEARKILEKAIQHAEEQNNANRSSKKALEMDWSDKKEAIELDTESAVLKPEAAVAYAGAACLPMGMSSMSDWKRFTERNLANSQSTRQMSQNLRARINDILTSTTREMASQAEVVQRELYGRLKEVEQGRIQLNDSLHQVLEEIRRKEEAIEVTRKSIQDMHPPLSMSLMRLHNSHQRPGVELCRDTVRDSLVQEVQEFTQTLSELSNSLRESELRLDQLNKCREKLLEELQAKQHTADIEAQRCISIRPRYPASVDMAGY